MSNLKIIQKKVSELKPATYNPRKIGKKEKMELKKSIKKFDFVEPIVININPKRKNIVIGGHQRLMIAQELGMKEVPCVGVNLQIKDEKELNLRLNKNKGEFDTKLLAGLDEKLLREVGFMESELSKVFADDVSLVKEEEFSAELLEENNYIVFAFNNSVDWMAIEDYFKLKSVLSKSSNKDYKQKGVGRVLDGQKLLDLIK
ncbi:MAG: hypothetical protein EOL88_00630 [Bacteroidia bacterium]|nr:hypothetical protein [Bacteroidia bacterium]